MASEVDPAGSNPGLGKRLDGRNELIVEPDIEIIDAQHHFYARPTMRYMAQDLVDDISAGHRVVATVYVETNENARTEGPEILRPLGEVEFANEIGERSGNGLYGAVQVNAAIVGHADLGAGDPIAELLDRSMEMAPARFRGVRQITLEYHNDIPFRIFVTAHRPTPGTLTSTSFREGFRHLGPRGLSYDAAVLSHQLPDLTALADDFPDTTIVLNHMGSPMAQGLSPVEKRDMFANWRKDLSALARRSNVVCKIGGLGMPWWGFGLESSDTEAPSETLARLWRPYINTTIELFGPDRCMMESNYPPDSRSCGYVPLWNALKRVVSDYSEQEKQAMFSGTASRIYRIDLGR